MLSVSSADSLVVKFYMVSEKVAADLQEDLLDLLEHIIAGPIAQTAATLQANHGYADDEAIKHALRLYRGVLDTLRAHKPV